MKLTLAHLGTAVAALLVVATAGTVAEARDPDAIAYLRYCSACHGESGKGDGVVSHMMRPKPSDLTRLAKDHDGEFPYLRILKIIDGRETIRAHGDPDMPVWGELFKDEAGLGLSQRAEVRGKLMLITDHLRAIQVK